MIARILNIARWSCCCLLFFVNFLFAQTRADFLIVTDPGDYTIFNQFEQPLGQAEKAQFLPFAPFRIIDQDQTLGDQITRALKFSLGGNTYYLLKDEGGSFTGEKRKTGRQTVRGCQVIDDTVAVVGAGPLAVSSIAGSVRRPAKGTQVVRVFRSGARWYVLASDGRPFYGWSTMEPSSAWRKSKTAADVGRGPADTLLAENLRERIIRKIADANRAYQALFSHFNGLTNAQKSVPQWRPSGQGPRLCFELTGPYGSGDQLAESTRELMQELENVLLGTGFGVTYTNGIMVIGRRGG